LRFKHTLPGSRATVRNSLPVTIEGGEASSFTTIKPRDLAALRDALRQPTGSSA
jgi:hypothetical protein